MVVPLFMKQIVEEISLHARKSRFVDQDSGVSARLSIANYKQMVATLDAEGKSLFERFVEIEEGHLAIVQAEIDMVSGTGYWFDTAEFSRG